MVAFGRAIVDSRSLRIDDRECLRANGMGQSSFTKVSIARYVAFS